MHYKSIFISDVHLGTKPSKADDLISFLRSNSADNLFLIGDIIDGWALQRRHYWKDKQTKVLRAILHYKNIIYLPGNHDDFVRPFLKQKFILGPLKVVDQYTYYSVSGKKIFVVHGDKWDFWMKVPKKLINFFAHFLDIYFHMPWINNARKNNQNPYLYLRTSNTERALKKYVEKNNYDFVICGHTHIPKIENDYMNCGDWVKHCSAILEHENGEFELYYHGKKDTDSN